jgi:hypothetical protein
MRNTLLFLLLLANQVFAQSEKTIELKTKVDHVTVYLQGALVTRNGSVSIEKGRSVLVLKGLSPYIDPKSIQVQATGPITLLSVNHAFNYLEDAKSPAMKDSLNAILESTEHTFAQKKNRLDVLTEKLSLLNENKKLGNELSSASIAQLKLAVDFYDQELMSIKSESLKLNNDLKKLNKSASMIMKQLEQLSAVEGKPTGEIFVRVESETKNSSTFSISYLVAQAGWFPKYDLRVKSIESPLQLTFKAEVHQNTGEDWENVKLRFSNGNPNQSGSAPQLSTWYLNFWQYQPRYEYSSGLMPVVGIGTVSGRIVDENNHPLHGVNVVIKGSSIGTVTDLNGNYNIALPNGASTLAISSIGYAMEEVAITSQTMNIRMSPDVTQLNEIVVTGYGGRSRAKTRYEDKPAAAMSPSVRIIENNTTVDFEVEMPYSLKSNGELQTINLKNHELPALYQYYAVPKIEKEAFLIARIPDWDKYNLLEGEANLYFEDGYVGRSVLNARNLTDTLDISLGRDKNILIAREKADNYSKRVVLGSNKTETKGFNIIARNKKGLPIQITIFDQVPVSANSEISVATKELSEGKLNSETGEIAWDLTLAPLQQKELKLIYEVRYPKKEAVMLE